STRTRSPRGLTFSAILFASFCFVVLLFEPQSNPAAPTTGKLFHHGLRICCRCSAWDFLHVRRPECRSQNSEFATTTCANLTLLFVHYLGVDNRAFIFLARLLRVCGLRFGSLARAPRGLAALSLRGCLVKLGRDFLP